MIRGIILVAGLLWLAPPASAQYIGIFLDPTTWARQSGKKTYPI